MSYDLIVYTRSSRFPEPHRLAEEVSARSPGLTLPPELDLRAADGYVPLASTGFEVSRSAVTPADVEDHREALKEAGDPDDEHLGVLLESDTCIAFHCQNDDEISTARIVAGAVAKLSGGYVYDPQLDVSARASYLPSPTVTE